MYGDLDKNSILYRLGEIFEAIDSGSYNRQQVIREVKVQLKRLLVLATDYGFDKNLWHNYIAFFLLMNENPFSLVCEKSAVSEGTVTSIVKEDFAHIRRIFFYDFSAVEQALGVNCFSVLSHYQAVKKSKKIYNWNVSEKVQALSQKLEAAADDDAFYQAVTGFYHDYGVGLFGLNKAFRVEVTPEGGIHFVAINNMDVVTLDDLVVLLNIKRNRVKKAYLVCILLDLDNLCGGYHILEVADSALVLVLFSFRLFILGILGKITELARSLHLG
jgi:hypothetical protein